MCLPCSMCCIGAERRGRHETRVEGKMQALGLAVVEQSRISM
jgi:hypothetical protein